MRKLFFVVASAFMLTGCLKGSEGDGAYEKVAAVLPGMYIRDGAQNQNERSLQPADMIMRLAMLKAEALKQGVSMDEVKVDDRNVKKILFGTKTTITDQGAGIYKLSFANSSGEHDAYSRTGDFLITTNGLALEDATQEKPWSIAMDSKEARIKFSSKQMVLYDNFGNTKVFRSNKDTYIIEFSGLVCKIEDAKIESSWTGTFHLSPSEAADLAYSQQKKTTFRLTGSATGAICESFNDRTATQMTYVIENGIFNPALGQYAYRQIIGGTERATLDDHDYDLQYYPAPSVLFSWSLNSGGNGVSYVVTYNGSSVTLP